MKRTQISGTNNNNILTEKNINTSNINNTSNIINSNITKADSTIKNKGVAQSRPTTYSKKSTLRRTIESIPTTVNSELSSDKKSHPWKKKNNTPLKDITSRHNNSTPKEESNPEKVMAPPPSTQPQNNKNSNNNNKLENQSDQKLEQCKLYYLEFEKCQLKVASPPKIKPPSSNKRNFKLTVSTSTTKKQTRSRRTPATPATPATPVNLPNPISKATPVTQYPPSTPVTPIVTPSAPVSQYPPSTPITPYPPATPATPVAFTKPKTKATPVTQNPPSTPITPVTPKSPATPITPLVSPSAPVTPLDTPSAAPIIIKPQPVVSVPLDPPTDPVILNTAVSDSLGPIESPVPVDSQESAPVVKNPPASPVRLEPTSSLESTITPVDPPTISVPIDSPVIPVIADTPVLVETPSVPVVAPLDILDIKDSSASPVRQETTDSLEAPVIPLDPPTLSCNVDNPITISVPLDPPVSLELPATSEPIDSPATLVPLVPPPVNIEPLELVSLDPPAPFRLFLPATPDKPKPISDSLDPPVTPVRLSVPSVRIEPPAISVSTVALPVTPAKLVTPARLIPLVTPVSLVSPVQLLKYPGASKSTPFKSPLNLKQPQKTHNINANTNNNLGLSDDSLLSEKSEEKSLKTNSIRELEVSRYRSNSEKPLPSPRIQEPEVLSYRKSSLSTTDTFFHPFSPVRKNSIHLEYPKSPRCAEQSATKDSFEKIFEKPLQSSRIQEPEVLSYRKHSLSTTDTFLHPFSPFRKNSNILENVKSPRPHSVLSAETGTNDLFEKPFRKNSNILDIKSPRCIFPAEQSDSFEKPFRKNSNILENLKSPRPVFPAESTSNDLFEKPFRKNSNILENLKSPRCGFPSESSAVHLELPKSDAFLVPFSPKYSPKISPRNKNLYGLESDQINRAGYSLDYALGLTPANLKRKISEISSSKKDVCFLSPRPSPLIYKRASSTFILSPIRKNFNAQLEGLFISVPNEILEFILSFLDSGKDLLSAGCVNKRWNFYANSTPLWQALYILHWDEPFIPIKSSKTWKQLYLKKKNSEFLVSQIPLNRSYGYARRKNVVRSDLLITDLTRETWKPEKKINYNNIFTTTNNKNEHLKKSQIIIKNDKKKKSQKNKKRKQEMKDEIIEDFLEERKQFFDSFYTTSLATTPMKNELSGRR